MLTPELLDKTLRALGDSEGTPGLAGCNTPQLIKMLSDTKRTLQYINHANIEMIKQIAELIQKPSGSLTHKDVANLLSHPTVFIQYGYLLREMELQQDFANSMEEATS